MVKTIGEGSTPDGLGVLNLTENADLCGCTFKNYEQIRNIHIFHVLYFVYIMLAGRLKK